MKLILPSGDELAIESGLSGYDAANRISASLAKKALAYRLDGKLFDLHSKIPQDGHFEVVTEGDKEAFELLNHSTSHLLAHAIMRLYPGAHIGFGPSIDEGFYYDIDFPATITDADLIAIENEMHKVAKENHRIIRREVSLEEALKLFAKNPYKVELIREIGANISIYEQGDFFDLCTGPHLPNTSFVRHFKLTSLAGAYWRGNSDNKQLTRIYGTSFFSKEELDKHLAILEERKKRDHRRLGKELGLFMVSEYGPGFPFWLPNGMILRNELENFWYKKHEQEGYVFIKTPVMLSKELWITSGHYENYRENMYFSQIDDREFAIKPMNCPGSLLVYKNELHSYKDFPIRVGELGLVHRHEASGALSGLFRVRAFTQDDAHIYCREDQSVAEVVRMLKLYDEVYSIFGLSYHIELSTRPEKKYIGSIENWNRSEKALADACKTIGRDYIVNEGDGAFYGPKLDFKLRDSMGRIWQCGTIQFDMNLPERFDITYIDSRGEKVRPVMLHRALFGSLERFIGILIEHYGGAFPTWLAPVQVNLIPVNNSLHSQYAHSVASYLRGLGIRASVDDSEEKVGFRLRNSQVRKIPYTIVIGDNEMRDQTVTYRLYGQEKQVTVSQGDFAGLISDEITSKRHY
ncbi:MAG TPA: threonine--tRNA ligase [Bacilli bacterium]|nr:threonine--tRNA ligase [Bacilli bacterium]